MLNLIVTIDLGSYSYILRIYMSWWNLSCLQVFLPIYFK